MIQYTIEIHPWSPFQEEFARGAMKAILEWVKSEFENKNKGNKFEYQERIFSDN